LSTKRRARRLDAGADFAPEILAKAGGIVRRYIEDHHERDEETHIFPRLEQIGAELDLLKTLREQHAAGRHLTSDVIGLATLATVRAAPERARLVGAMRLFIRMYRPHAARENTVLFPAFRKAVSEKEYENLQRALEKSEHDAFGDHLYETVLDEVRGLEGALGHRRTRGVHAALSRRDLVPPFYGARAATRLTRPHARCEPDPHHRRNASRTSGDSASSPSTFCDTQRHASKDNSSHARR
jgi:hemerythrin-like domain-containing protein